MFGKSAMESQRHRFAGMFLSAVVAALLTGGLVGSLSLLDLPNGHILTRYVTGHWIESIEIGFFIWGMIELAQKVRRLRRDRRALGFEWLDRSAGSIHVHQAGLLADELRRAPVSLQQTTLGRRLMRIVTDIGDRQGTDHLDDLMRDLSDQDAEELHQGFALTRVIAWAIPILGFLGTVIGITVAIANITPSQLEDSLPDVTGGLAVAFDTTALALSLSIVLIFAMFVVERMEQITLRAVDTKARNWLGHRFVTSNRETAPYLSSLYAIGEEVIRHTKSLVDRQGQLWNDALARIFAEWQQSTAERESTFVRAMRDLADRKQQDLGTMLAAQQRIEEGQRGMERIAELLVVRTGDEKALVDSQQRLIDNLRLLNETKSFDEAMHSLTAAIHLLTVRAHSLTQDRSQQQSSRNPDTRAA